MNQRKFFITIAWLLVVGALSAQNSGKHYDRIAFYNVENFFDILPDTVLDYNQYTPNGDHHWNLKRYNTKRNHIYKVIAALGGWQGVTIMGFAEIENRSILEDLVKNTPLKQMHYQIVHFESHDHRGIDVGIIYNPNRFTVLHAHKIPIVDTTDPSFHTRDILYIKGLIDGDTLHLFVNHWPSRYGGMMQTIPKRKLVAHILKRVVDSVSGINTQANILVMGDFNDNPDDESLQILEKGDKNHALIPLPWNMQYHLATGSLKHLTEWDVFDQMLVSESLKKRENSLGIQSNNYTIFDARFLLEKDEKNQGYTTNRTYRGFVYHGGFSDHLPVYLDIIKVIKREK